MRIRSFTAATILASLSSLAQAQDFLPDMKDVHFTVGVRFWQTDWSTWVEPISSTYSHADLRWSVIPVVSVSYRDWFVSGSYQTPGTFNFEDVSFNFKRREYDANLGYFFVPGRLAVTAGWKEVRYTGGTYRWRAKGPTIGITGNAPVANWASIYGNIGYGRPKVDDEGLFKSKHGKYLLTEFGVAFPLGAHADMLSGAVLTAGYRYQRIGAYASDNTLVTSELFEIAQGPVIGLAMRF